MDNDIVNGIYVDIDSIVDTRLSLMYDIDKNVMAAIIEDKSYFKRVLDQFGYISAKLFRRIYAMRNSNVLDNPMHTEVLDVVRDYCVEANISSKSYNGAKEVTIYLNIYPYNISEESKELLIMAIKNHVKSKVEVVILNDPMDKIEPLFILDNMAMVIMYDALTWIEHNVQNKELMKYPMPDITFITPALVHRSVIISKKEIVKFFEDLEKNLSPLVNISFVPSKIFSFKQKKKV